MAKIIVFGAAGLLGRALKEKLGGEHEVVEVVRPGSRINSSQLEIDLAHPDLSILPRDADAIFYLAQSKYFREFPSKSLDMLQLNVVAPVLIADWARQYGVRKFIHCSSGGVYDENLSQLTEVLEINASRDKGFYLGTKLSSEILLRCYAKYFDSLVLLRPFFIYGPEQKSDMLIPRLVNNVKAGKPIQLQGEEGIKINPIHVSDAAQLVSASLRLKEFQLLNLAGPETITIKRLCDRIGELLCIKPIYEPAALGSQNFVADIRQMSDLLGQPQIGISDGVKTLISLDA